MGFRVLHWEGQYSYPQTSLLPQVAWDLIQNEVMLILCDRGFFPRPRVPQPFLTSKLFFRNLDKNIL